MPTKKSGRFEFSHKEVVHVRRELSSFLMTYVNFPKIPNISNVKKDVFNFVKGIVKVDFGEENVWVVRSNSREPIECGVFLWPFQIQFTIVPRKEEEKKNESKSKV